MPGQSVIGRRFGKVTVLRRADVDGYYYVCACDCGTEKTIHGAALRVTKSCGCVRDALIIQVVPGQRFGKLTVAERSAERSNRGALWICKCDCGATVTRSSSHLNGGSKACSGSCANIKLHALNGELVTQSQIAEACGKSHTTVSVSLSAGLTPDDIFAEFQPEEAFLRKCVAGATAAAERPHAEALDWWRTLFAECGDELVVDDRPSIVGTRKGDAGSRALGLPL